MPSSDVRLRPWILSQLRERTDLASIRSVLDIGAGDGGALDFYGPHMPAARWMALEIWEPYDAMFGLSRRYDQVIIGDAREASLPESDLCILGDVLEHMPAPDAVALWERARAASQLLVIGLPVEHLPQGAVYGNPWEAHVADWDIASVLAAFPGIVAHHGQVEDSAVGAFIAEGLR
jgi:hypothetical protein